MLLGIARDPGRIEIMIGRLGIGGKGKVVNFSIVELLLGWKESSCGILFYWIGRRIYNTFALNGLDRVYKILLGITRRIEVKIGRDWEGLKGRGRSKLLISLDVKISSFVFSTTNYSIEFEHVSITNAFGWILWGISEIAHRIEIIIIIKILSRLEGIGRG